MSSWTYINGVIDVDMVGRTQPEKRYILDTVLEHLPKVTGSNGNMNIYVIQKLGRNSGCSHDEFGRYSNLGNGNDSWYRAHPSFESQSEYILVVNGRLRDRTFKQTFKELSKWLCRLAKRVDINDVLVKLEEYDRSYLFTNKNECYSKMVENPSWMNKDGEPAWWEYLMWERMDNSEYPRLLAYKYFADKENDKKVEAWIRS